MTFEFERQHRLPDNEFANDLEHQKSMETGYANFIQNYPEQFKAWEETFKNSQCSKGMNKEEK